MNKAPNLLLYNKEGYEVEAVLCSINNLTQDRLLTFRLRYPRIVHAENMTHRNFSTNAGSSRAKPVPKFLQEVREDPAMPFRFGANQRGMQDTGVEHDGKIVVPQIMSQAFNKWIGDKTTPIRISEDGETLEYLADGRTFWRFLAWLNSYGAEAMHNAGYHKQVANRPLEPYQWMNVLRTGNYEWWEAWLRLRDHKDADPTIAELARLVREILPILKYQQLGIGDWHIPWMVDGEEKLPLEEKLVLSTARSARVSIEPFDGSPEYEKEKARHDLLLNSDPMHASPFEHAACAMVGSRRRANLQGFAHYRYALEGHHPLDKIHHFD